ncbi:hypothetical protein A6770_08200 [Nostoc minutum NIES-26]|uniref:Uncharacterized protein n=1 Tax=Nostoc minutum NIES-26 TaxID=1844469 RepID=A0A367S2F8_9NOSO|nr:hypothetical protein A6770_08200 [Nostoc minutum NIES-26]
MFDPLILTFVLGLIIPFCLAQIMPNMKWLIAYAFSFGTLATYLHYDHLTRPIERQGNGFVYLFATALIYLISLSGIIGIVNRSVILFLKSEGYKINILFIINILCLDVMIIYIAFLMWK